MTSEGTQNQVNNNLKSFKKKSGRCLTPLPRTATDDLKRK